MSGTGHPLAPRQRDENSSILFLRSRWMHGKRRRMRVLVADGHPVFRYGLRMLLQPEADLHVVGEAADGAEALTLANKLKPHILLINPAAKGNLGAQVLGEIARAHPGLHTILLLAADADKQQIIDALQLGVRGVVLKTAVAKTYVKSIRMVMAGECWVPNISDLLRVLYSGSADPHGKQKTAPLTTRELEIVIAIASGHTNKDVAQRFSISDNTVKHHLTNIFDKLGVSNRLELAILAIGRGLIPAA